MNYINIASEIRERLTATVIFPRMHSGMGPWIRFFSFSAHVPISSMAMNTSVCEHRNTGFAV